MLSPVECYERAVAALHGDRVSLDDGASKMLSFLLTEVEGSDAEVTPEKFIVKLGAAAPHRYESWTVPGLVSWLVERIGTSVNQTVTGAIAPANVRYRVGAPTWSFSEPRHVRIEARPGHLQIRIRSSAAALAHDMPRGASDRANDRRAPPVSALRGRREQLSRAGRPLGGLPRVRSLDAGR